MIKKLIEKGLDYCLKYNSFQNYVNFRFNDPTKKIIYDKFLKNSCCEYKGLRWNVNDMLWIIDDVLHSYQYQDIKNNDVVLDIGANIGAFTIFASKKAKHVYAVEPLWDDILRKNIKLNKIHNASILSCGLGIEKEKINFNGREQIVDCYSLSKIMKICGRQIDFLKCDCEGGEWYIRPDELKGIRRIEAEVHNFDGKHDFNNFLKMLSIAGFEYEYEILPNKICMIVHASQKPKFDSISEQPKT